MSDVTRVHRDLGSPNWEELDSTNGSTLFFDDERGNVAPIGIYARNPYGTDRRELLPVAVSPMPLWLRVMPWVAVPFAFVALVVTGTGWGFLALPAALWARRGWRQGWVT